MGNQQNFGAAQKDNRAKKQLALAITTALLATGGIQSLDGAAGGGINPWAIIAGYGTNDQIDPTASFTNVTLPDFSVNQLGVSIGIFNRLELSYAYQTGTLGITSIIDDFVGNVAADNRINTYFAHANIPFLKISLVNQVCEALGGPCKYTGPAMKPLHHSMGVTQAAFNALTEDLQLSMTKYNVPIPAQNHLIGILAPMSKDIITK